MSLRCQMVCICYLNVINYKDLFNNDIIIKDKNKAKIYNFFLKIFSRRKIDFKVCNCSLQIAYFFLKTTICFLYANLSYYFTHKCIKVKFLKNKYFARYFIYFIL